MNTFLLQVLAHGYQQKKVGKIIHHLFGGLKNNAYLYIMKIANNIKKMVAYSLEEFKKIIANKFEDKTDGYVVTRIHNNMMQCKWVATKEEALKLIK